MTVFTMIIPAFTAQAAGNDVGDKITVSKLEIKKVEIQNGNTVTTDIYDATGTTPITPLEINIGNSVTISFDLRWEVKEGEAGFFNEDDYFEIPILEAQGISALVPPDDYDFELWSAEAGGVLLGAGRVISAGGKLSFKVIFNDKAHGDDEVTYGTAEGTATLSVKDSQIKFADETTYTQFLKPGDPDPDTPPPVDFPSPGWKDSTDSRVLDDDNFGPGFELSKAIYGASTDSDGKMTPRQFAKALPAPAVEGHDPDRKYPAYRWSVPFFDLQKSFEADPARTPTGYVIFEDIISANQKFSNYDALSTGAGYAGATYPEGGVWESTTDNTNPGASYKNDFFAFGIPYKYFNTSIFFNGNVDASYGYYTGVFAYQRHFKHFVTDASDAIYSSQYEVVLPSEIESKVNTTPLSYAIIPLADGRTKLIINAGQFGAGVPAGEGIKINNLSHKRGNGDESFETGLLAMINQFLGSAESYYKVIAKETGPYKTIEDNFTAFETLLAGYSTETGYASALLDLQSLKAATLGASGILEGGQAYESDYYREAGKPWAGTGLSQGYLIWLATSETRLYQNLNTFLSNIGLGNVSAYASDTARYAEFLETYATGPEAEAAWENFYKLRVLASAIDSGLSNYGLHMNNLKNTKLLSESALETVFFHFPELREMVVDALIDANVLSAAGDYSTNALLTAGMFPAGDELSKLADIRNVIGDKGFYSEFYPGHDFVNPGGSIPTFREPGTKLDFAVSSLQLLYETIQIDTNVAKVGNQLTVRVPSEGFNSDVSKEYSYRFAASIHTRRGNGGAAFVKASITPEQAAALQGQFWDAVTLDEFSELAGNALRGAKFKIFATEQNAMGDVNPLEFVIIDGEEDYYKLKTDENTGIITTITTGASGQFAIEGLPAGVKYYIKEVGAPAGHVICNDVFEFSVTATGDPLTYAAYNEGDGKIYDAALKKWVSKVQRADGTDVSGQYNTSSSGNSTLGDLYEKNVPTAPVKVKIGNYVTYKIRVYNQCDEELTITEILDDAPAGLEFVPAGTEIGGVPVNAGWETSGSNIKWTGELKLAPQSDPDRTSNTYGETNSKIIEVVFKVVSSAPTGAGAIVNTAEIVKMENEDGDDVSDQDDDSTPDEDLDNDGEENDTPVVKDNEIEEHREEKKVDDSKDDTQDEDDHDIAKIVLDEDEVSFFSISKRKITGDDELPGATLTVFQTDAQGNKTTTIATTTSGESLTWTSGSTDKVIEGLPAGTYVLHEDAAPAGYALASDITFTVDANGNVTGTSEGAVSSDGKTLIMKDEITSFNISKRKITGDTELPGAKLTVFQTDTQGNKTNTIATTISGESLTWTSGSTQKTIEGLSAGTYVLHEEIAPDGYVVATDIKFTLGADGKVTSTGEVINNGTTLVMRDALENSFFISKRKITGDDELPGATLTVFQTDAQGNKTTTIATTTSGESLTWTSGSTEKVIEGLSAGTYVLHEDAAPAGYVLASDITFTVDADGNVTSTGEGAVSSDGKTLIMKDAITSFNISKREITGDDELPGAKLEILKKGTNEVVKSWTSGNAPEKIEGLPAGTYILRETIAPNGYELATDIEFTLGADGKVTSTGEVINSGTTLVMRDALDNSFFISKRKITGDDELPGAKLEILKKGTNEVVKSWTSGNAPEKIEGLAAGTYILRETIAPNGYALATDIEFTVDANGKLTSAGEVINNGTTLIMRDAMKSDSSEESSSERGRESSAPSSNTISNDGDGNDTLNIPVTGDFIFFIAFLLAAAFLSGVTIIVTKQRKKTFR